MNVISFNAAYCLYPRATLEERISIVCTTRQDQVIENIYNKYTARGWRIIRDVDDLETMRPDPALHPRRVRWIQDGLSWSIQLPLPNRFGNSLPPLNDRTKVFRRDPVSVTSWRLLVDEDSRTCFASRSSRTASVQVD